MVYENLPRSLGDVIVWTNGDLTALQGITPWGIVSLEQWGQGTLVGLVWYMTEDLVEGALGWLESIQAIVYVI